MIMIIILFQQFLGRNGFCFFKKNFQQFLWKKGSSVFLVLLWFYTPNKIKVGSYDLIMIFVVSVVLCVACPLAQN
jgi:hypothetical protein